MEVLHPQAPGSDFAGRRLLSCDTRAAETTHKWYAVHTAPQHERSVVKHLDAHRIESFLPTWEYTHVWKNRQRAKIVQPVFPCYLFVRIQAVER